MPEPAGTTTVTFSPSYTIVPTFECFNSCGYCSFKARRGEPRAKWMTVSDAEALMTRLANNGSSVDEILVLSGEVHPQSKRRKAWFDMAMGICQAVAAAGYLPHANIGPLSREEMAALAGVNASMGLMLEQSSRRLYTMRKPGPYARGAPSKDPELRAGQLELAGELRVPFTTGILVGIGETIQEIEESLQAIASSALRHGHIQECIVQPYMPGSGQGQEWEPPAGTLELRALPDVVATAREMLPAEVVVQVPPNLVRQRPDVLRACLDAGARDLGGMSPRDEVNPDYDFPDVEELRHQLSSWGYDLVPRRAVHSRLASWAFAGQGIPDPALFPAGRFPG